MSHSLLDAMWFSSGSQRLWPVALVLACAGCSGPAHEAAARGDIQQPVVYGDDDRVEARDYADAAFVELATEVVGALVSRRYLFPQDDCRWLLAGPSLQQCAQLCEDEPLIEQPCLASCAAVLIGPDTILTAGHCVPADLHDVVFVRGYALGAEFPLVAPDHVHELEELLGYADGDIATETGQDFATLRIRTGAALAFSDMGTNTQTVALGDPVLVIGTSEALPMKIDAGGQIVDASAPDYLEITSDTFGGGSGSPSYTPSGELLGIVVGGNVDYELDETELCVRRRRLSQPSDRAELLVRIDAIRRGIPEPVLAPLLADPVETCPGAPERVEPPPGAGCSLGPLGTKRSRMGWGVWLSAFLLFLASSAHQSPRPPGVPRPRRWRVLKTSSWRFWRRGTLGAPWRVHLSSLPSGELFELCPKCFDRDRFSDPNGALVRISPSNDDGANTFLSAQHRPTGVAAVDGDVELEVTVGHQPGNHAATRLRVATG